MDNALLINCQTKKYQAFTNIAFAFGLSVVIGTIWERFGFSWWYVLILAILWSVGILSFMSLLKGGWKIFILIQKDRFLITYRTQWYFNKHKTHIESGEVFTDAYTLAGLENIWVKILRLNHSLIGNDIKIRHNGATKTLVSLESKGVKLKEADFHRMVSFLQQHSPGLRLSIPD